jgi:hypothetical protein
MGGLGCTSRVRLLAAAAALSTSAATGVSLPTPPNTSHILVLSTFGATTTLSEYAADASWQGAPLQSVLLNGCLLPAQPYGLAYGSACADGERLSARREGFLLSRSVAQQSKSAFFFVRAALPRPHTGSCALFTCASGAPGVGIVGRVSANGTVDLSTQFPMTGAGASGGAASLDGNEVYATSVSDGIVFGPVGGSLTIIDAGAGYTGQQVFSFGGAPTLLTAGCTVAQTPCPVSGAGVFYSSPSTPAQPAPASTFRLLVPGITSVPGIGPILVASSTSVYVGADMDTAGGGLYRFDNADGTVNTTWTPYTWPASGGAALNPDGVTQGVHGLTGRVEGAGGSFVLYLTTSDASNGLYRYDTSNDGLGSAASAFVLLASAPTRGVLHGVFVVPPQAATVAPQALPTMLASTVSGTATATSTTTLTPSGTLSSASSPSSSGSASAAGTPSATGSSSRTHSSITTPTRQPSGSSGTGSRSRSRTTTLSRSGSHSCIHSTTPTHSHTATRTAAPSHSPTASITPAPTVYHGIHDGCGHGGPCWNESPTSTRKAKP